MTNPSEPMPPLPGMPCDKHGRTRTKELIAWARAYGQQCAEAAAAMMHAEYERIYAETKTAEQCAEAAEASEAKLRQLLMASGWTAYEIDAALAAKD